MSPDLPELLTGVPLSGFEPQDVREASEAVRSYCGWHIAPAINETLTLRVDRGRGIVILPTLQLNSVTSVTVEGALWSASDYEVYLGRTASIDLGRGVLPRRVVIAFNHGYTEAPADVIRVVKSLARSGATGSSVRVGSVQISSSTGTTAVSLTSLRPYQLPAVA